MSPEREVGSCSCHEHQASDRLKQIIKEKDEEIAILREQLEIAQEKVEKADKVDKWEDE